MAPDDTDKADWPPHRDAVAAAPRNHRVLWEDDEVRVLDVTVRPGEREELDHHQWPSIMVLLSRPRYVNHDEAGNQVKPAIVLQSDPVFPLAVRLPPQRHYVEVLSGEPAASACHQSGIETPGP